MTTPAASASRDRADLQWGVLLALALVVWHLPGLTLVPAPNHDEVMLTAAARNWTAHGVAALTPLAGNGESYATAYYWHPPGHLWVMALAYQLLGFSIGVTRGVCLAGGALAVFLLFQLLRAQGLTRPGAATGVALFAAHPLVWWLCRSGRMDLSAVCLGLGAMLLLAHAPDPGPGRAAGAGLLVGLAALFHVMALVWAPALLAAEATRGRQLAWRHALLTAGFAALPLATWVAVVFLRGDGPAWIEQFVGYQLGQRTASSPLWRRVPDELLLVLAQFKFLPATLLLAGTGLAVGWDAGQRARWWSAAGALAAFVLIAIGTAKGSGAYPLYWFLWAIPVAAAGLARLRPGVRGGLVALALANAAAVQGGQAGVALYQRAARDPDRIDRFFAAQVKPGAIVLGPEDIWYAVEHAGATLRIWEQPDPARHDYVVTFGNLPATAPAGFVLQAELPDTMPRVFGRYLSNTPFSYRLWSARRPTPETAGGNPARPSP